MIEHSRYTCQTASPYSEKLPKAIDIGGDNYPILGESQFINRVKKQIDFASAVDYSIFVSGEAGCEKMSIAYQIHRRGPNHSGNFIYVPALMHDSHSYKSFLRKSFELARGGTLYLAEVDSLSAELKDDLISVLALDEFKNLIHDKNVRLIVSCLNPLISSEPEQQFVAKIISAYSPQLNIHIPALRERVEDLPCHIQHILSNINPELSITDGGMSLLANYAWPGNVTQLQRVLLILASYCDERITTQDIMTLNIIGSHHESFDIVDIILSQKFELLQELHPGLLKAIVYMSEHFKEDLSLPKLASFAFTSTSHLSYLFREHLKASFKSVLVQVRIRFAKELIDSSPMHKITDICMRSGFGDLSHFEKMFKRYVGCTPRQYRHDRRQVMQLRHTI